ncbi:DUF4365 domain-containing protein [Chryseobacterium sp. 09-1422]|uniref:DUF4365 domain-containing protein n=1 Tax=Chryseobacterium kimseyorum TaxID=2984028 RepID=A0ABT3HVV5_9FLAO|nr:DUF4365 domain-containing protein [Chryseobacterium kimseyorum]MCW3167926.1 DUF4365 domain-containing protein [Chryseobacterium kimseyorum]
MPQRTKNHIIEDESRLAFYNSLPKHWVYRDKDKDYGVDCEVEIFDELGNASGLIFWVQLKATESQSLKIIENMLFKPEKVYQYHSYSIPVMIVRYSKFQDKLYFRWAIDYTNQKKTLNKIKVGFDDSQVLENDFEQKIISYLQRYRTVSNSNITFPINTVVLRHNGNYKIPAVTIEYINKIIYKNPKYFKLVRKEDQSLLQIKVKEDIIYYTLTDKNFSSSSYESKSLTNESFNFFNEVILSSISILLYTCENENLGNEIFFENNLLQTIKDNNDYLIHFLPYLLSGNFYQEVLNKLDNMFDENSDNMIQIISLVVQMSATNGDAVRRKVFEDFLHKQFQYSMLRGEDLSLSAAAYNLGNHYKSQGKHSEALFYYLKAKRFNPSYLLQNYYYFELGGIFFSLQKYSLAIKCYSKSIELNSDNKYVKAHLGDALMYDGKFEKAVESIDDFLTEQSQTEIEKNEWFLKYFCLKSLLLSGYPTEQKRNSFAAQKSLEIDKIQEALDYDMLYENAWRKNGVLASKDPTKKLETFISFCMNSILNTGDIIAWVNAIVSGFSTDEDSNIVYQVIKVAYYYNGQDLINYLNEEFYINNSNLIEPLLNIIDSLDLPEPKKEFAVRIFGDEVNYLKIDLI